jgi:hypothetical protein
MHKGGDFVIGEGRQLIESGHPVLHALPVMAVQNTAHVLEVCHHRHRLRLRDTLPRASSGSSAAASDDRASLSLGRRCEIARHGWPFFGGKIGTPFRATRMRPSSLLRDPSVKLIMSAHRKMFGKLTVCVPYLG